MVSSQSTSQGAPCQLERADAPVVLWGSRSMWDFYAQATVTKLGRGESLGVQHSDGTDSQKGKWWPRESMQRGGRDGTFGRKLDGRLYLCLGYLGRASASPAPAPRGGFARPKATAQKP